MQFKMVHVNLNVLNMKRSTDFYEKALGMKEARRKEAPDGSYVLVFMEDGISPFQLELTWLADRKEPYALGDNETHIAFRAQDFEAAHQLHQQMGCICFENPTMGIYFICDPDGYWLEIVPTR